MKVTTVFTLGLALALGTTYAEAPKPVSAPTNAQDRAAARARMAEKIRQATGGKIEKPGSLKGLIAVVDTGSGLSEAHLERSLATFRMQSEYNFRVLKSSAGDPASVKERVGANIAVVVVADGKAPPLLVAPEEGWAQVNVAKLRKGIPEGKLGDELYATRCRKEIVRAVSIVCGGFGTPYKGGVLCAATVEELDTSREEVPLDVIQLYRPYLKSFGVTPREVAYYRTAVTQGWAPAPTNDAQKAIWDKIHAMPTEPIRIKPESQRKK